VYNEKKGVPVKNRSEYLKIYLSPSEMKILELKEKNLREHYKSNGEYYNQQEHIRTFLLNSDSDTLMTSVFDFALSDFEANKRMAKK